MKTVLQSGPYRFFFFSSDRGEPPHIHVAERRNAQYSGPCVKDVDEPFVGYYKVCGFA